MGPVSFETIEIGHDRIRALVLTEMVTAEGIRAELLTYDAAGLYQPLAGPQPYKLLVRNEDAARVRDLVAAADDGRLELAIDVDPELDPSD